MLVRQADDVTTYERRLVRAGEADRRRTPAFALAVVAALLGAVAVLTFLSGGYVLERTAPVILALGALGIVLVWLLHAPLARPAPASALALAAFAAFVVWTGLSVLWSIGPDLSWIAFDVAGLYLLVLVALSALPGGPAQLRLAAYGFAAIVLVAATYALLGKLVPEVVTHAHLYARLSAPVGYWNVLAAMIAMALPIVVTVAASKELSPWLRGVAAGCLVLLILTLFFTFSRGVYVALVPALLVFFAATRQRLSAFVSLIIPTVLVAAVLFALRHSHTLFSATTSDTLRSSQGHTLAVWFLVAAAAAFGAQVLAALALRRWRPSAKAARTSVLVAVAVVVLLGVAFSFAYFPRHGGFGGWMSAHYHAALSSGGPSNDVGRLTSLGSSGRIPWYREALKGFSHHMLAGTGAGTFRYTNYLYRQQALVVMHSHSQWLNVLSELGLVGFVLFVVAIGALVWAAFGRVRPSADERLRPLLAACQAAVVLFVVHMSIDWDWDMAAAGLSFLLLAGVSASYIASTRQSAAAEEVAASPLRGQRGRGRQSAGLGLLGKLLVTAVLAFGMLSWLLPYLSSVNTAAAVDQMSRSHTAKAISSAQRARRLDPLAVEPLLVLAMNQTIQGEPGAAGSALTQALRLQPRNFEVYYRIGVLEFYAGRYAEAVRWLHLAQTLNPLDSPTRLQLSAAKAAERPVQ